MLILILLLLKSKVYGVWWNNSPEASSGFGICCSSIHTEGRITCQLLHGWFYLSRYASLKVVVSLNEWIFILCKNQIPFWMDSTMEVPTLDGQLGAPSSRRAMTMMLHLMNMVRTKRVTLFYVDALIIFVEIGTGSSAYESLSSWQSLAWCNYTTMLVVFKNKKSSMKPLSWSLTKMHCWLTF